MKRYIIMENFFWGEGLWSEIELGAQTPVKKMLDYFQISTSSGDWQMLKDKFNELIQAKLISFARGWGRS
jgi:hypothetical protein